MVGLTAGNPAPQVTYSYIQGTNVRLTYIDANGVQTQRISYSGHSESFPTEWTAEFINPVARPYSYDYVLENLLAQMDDRNSWSLKPNPSRSFNAWNVQIKIPKEWRINYSMGRNSMESNGAIMATVYLIQTNAGTQVIQSRFGNYQNDSPVALEVDPTAPVSVMFNNNKLSVSFSACRQRS